MWVHSESPRKRLFRTPRSACFTDNMFETFVHFGRCLCCLLPLFVNKQLSCPHTNSPQKPLVLKRARSWGVKWVQVSPDKPSKKAKEPHAAGSQQPASTHKEHQVLSTTKAVALLLQPSFGSFSEASQHDLRKIEEGPRRQQK